MIPGEFKHRAELAILASLLIVGGWSVEALIYALAVVTLALVSAAVVDLLLVATRSPEPVETAFNACNPWLVATLAVLTVAVAPALVLGEFAPPLALLIYPIFVAYFGGAHVKEFVDLSSHTR